MTNMTAASEFETLFREEFLSTRLTQWLDWASGQDERHFVALPMIQRGSVWKPLQIITLWDSLLRGMPIGGLMLSRLHPLDKNNQPVQVRKVGSSQLQAVPAGGGAALIDGQQRTLAMLLGWPHAGVEQRQGRTLWVDLADKPGKDTLFRMHVTSKAHPYGYTKADPNVKLSLSERRKAKAVSTGEPYPWESHFPVRLSELIQIFQGVGGNLEEWKTAVLAQLRSAKPHREKSWQAYEADTSKWNALQALDRFGLALQALFKLKLPLIAIPEKCFTQDATENGDEPTLAVLFKRVGTGGTPLSDADYVYSVIKHHLPETFQLVESLAADKGFAQLLGPIDIVMTAVRLVAADMGATDFENPSKANFDSLRKDANFLKNFLTLVKSDRFRGALGALTEELQFKSVNGALDPGLPMQGFILASRPVLQILLYWLLQAHKGTTAHADGFTALVAQSRQEILRFVLYAQLGFVDDRKASTWAFAWLKTQDEHSQNGFPGKRLVAHLIQRSDDEKRDVAWTLPSKALLESLALSNPPDRSKPLLGWERFQVSDESMRKTIGVFRRWWGSGRYQNPMLLWLQRDYVDQIDKNPEEVRSDDEVPYDYDHICPANHWSYWTGVRGTDRLIDHLSKPNNGGHYHVGNSIGNVRVWYASHNRADGDAPAAVKLNLDGKDEESSTTLLHDSAIGIEEREWWTACSPRGSGTSWNADRAWAFQNAVERRVSRLYARYFDELDFSCWFPLPPAEDTTPAPT